MPRGKQLGGSSAINIMMILHPTRDDLDSWGELGNEGWSFDTMAPYYKKMATVTPPGPNAKKITHVDEWYDPTLDGKDGPLHLSWGQSYPASLNGAWVETFENLGLNMTHDPRCGRAIGGFQNMQAVDPATKTRSYAATAHYGTEQRARKNLYIFTDTTAKKITTEKTDHGVVATGVLVRLPSGTDRMLSAKREVILSAGTLQSPQILELSGIGNRELLERHGIPVVIENANVGERIHDHMGGVELFEARDGIPTLDILNQPEALAAAMAAYKVNGTGILSQSPATTAYAPYVDHQGRLSQADLEALLDTHLGDPANDTQEMQIIRRNMLNPENTQIQYLLLNFPLPIPDAEGVTPTFEKPQVAILPILNHPMSRGSVHIASPDIDVKPTWEPNFLAHPLDLELLARACQFGERIAATAPFTDALTGGRWPDLPADTLERAKQIVRRTGISVYHPTGSCAMRPAADGGVVDARLRVHGTANLRVVDASVVPLEPSGNIQATVYAIAERAADMIKEDASTKV